MVFSLISEDGDEGFPGTVLSSVTYRLTEDNAVSVSMSARQEILTQDIVFPKDFADFEGN